MQRWFWRGLGLFSFLVWGGADDGCKYSPPRLQTFDLSQPVVDMAGETSFNAADAWTCMLRVQVSDCELNNFSCIARTGGLCFGQITTGHSGQMTYEALVLCVKQASEEQPRDPFGVGEDPVSLFAIQYQTDAQQTEVLRILNDPDRYDPQSGMWSGGGCASEAYLARQDGFMP